MFPFSVNIVDIVICSVNVALNEKSVQLIHNVMYTQSLLNNVFLTKQLK